jgi:LuxR family transcriptional regulator, maltose regulon positive regulatory protein
VSTPILATKLYIPAPRLTVVLRPRLVERLNEGLHRKMILISAPAGFGKSTLISEWVAGCGLPVAWLSLDERDNDLLRFLTYLISALQTISANFGAGVLNMIQSPQSPPIESILTVLVNEITTVQDNFIVVLDDYHLIDSKAVDNTLASLLERLPRQMHLVIATREDPHLPLSRLRVRDQLIELRATDLRFSPAEAADFLNLMMGLNLPAEDIAALETRTEGWIAGLQLAALAMLAMQRHQDTTSFIKSFTGSHYFVVDYLIEEVLHQQSEDIKTFLLRTSILDRMCGPLCDAVLGSPPPSGQETLEYLERANLFIVPLDNERRWYRYHHLFGDLLRNRLGKPKEFAEFHLRASLWHEENGDLGAAFHHAIAAGDFVRAAGLAEGAWQDMNGSFQSATWLGWVKKLPEDVICLRPVLSTQMGFAFMDVGDPEASESCLQDAERCLNGSSGGMVVTDKAQLQPLPAMISLARAYIAQVQGDLAATVRYTEQALQIIPEDDFDLRARAIITLEVTHWASGDLESACAALGDWMNSMQKVGNFTFIVASAFALADMLVGLGRLIVAERTYKDALQLASQRGPEAERITAHHHLGLSMIYRQRGNDTLAVHHLKRAAELGLQTTLVDWLYRWHIAQAELKEAAGDLETALDLLEEAKRDYIQTAVPDLRPIAALKARIHLKQGQPDKTRAWVAERGLSLADEVSYLHEFEHLTLARLEFANPLVNTLLARLLQAAEAQKRQGSVLDILIVEALAHEAQGNRPQALASLESALALAEPEGYVRIFLDEGSIMAQLILKAAVSGIMPDYTGKLLAAFEAEQLRSAGESYLPTPRASQLPFEQISQRELEILRLFKTELSGPEIARELVIALSTVRTHTKSIYSKLNVNNRRAAVKRAEVLHLI